MHAKQPLRTIDFFLLTKRFHIAVNVEVQAKYFSPLLKHLLRHPLVLFYRLLVSGIRTICGMVLQALVSAMAMKGLKDP